MFPSDAEVSAWCGVNRSAAASLFMLASARPPAASLSPHLLLLVVVVGGGEEVAEDELGHVDPLLLVHLHRHAGAVVQHLDRALLLRSWERQGGAGRRVSGRCSRLGGGGAAALGCSSAAAPPAAAAAALLLEPLSSAASGHQKPPAPAPGGASPRQCRRARCPWRGRGPCCRRRSPGSRRRSCRARAQR